MSKRFKGYYGFTGKGVAQLCQVTQAQHLTDSLVYRCPSLVVRHLRKGGSGTSARRSKASVSCFNCAAFNSRTSKTGKRCSVGLLNFTQAPLVSTRLARSKSSPKVLLSQRVRALACRSSKPSRNLSGHQTLDKTGSDIKTAVNRWVFSHIRPAISTLPARDQSSSASRSGRLGRGRRKGAR